MGNGEFYDEAVHAGICGHVGIRRRLRSGIEPFSVLFFEGVRAGAVELFVSSVTLDELEGAPETVRVFFEGISPFVQRLEIGEDAYALRQAYLRACVVSPKWAADALHVVVASVSGFRAIVSYFKHIVNLRRIPLYNGVNLTEGYGPIAIHTPPEVISYEEGF